MASGLVYKVAYNIPDSKTYGFQLLSKQEVDAISNRLYRTHTRSSAVTESDRKNFVSQSSILKQSLLSSDLCPKFNLYKVDVVAVIASAQKKPSSSRQLQQLSSRLASPRIKELNKTLSHVPSKLEMIENMSPASITTLSEKKRVQRLTRPTTASSLKRLGACGYCDSTEFDYKLFDKQLESERIPEPQLTQEQYEMVLRRARTPTNASLCGEPKCSKFPSDMEIRPKSKDLPLMCGLPKSPNFHDITSRLHYTKKTHMKETMHRIF